MLFEEVSGPTERMSEPRSVNGIDNQQVLEFLRLVAELKQVAELLSIEPPRPRSANKRRRSG